MSEEPTRLQWRSLALDPECVLGPWARLAVCALCENMGGEHCYVSIPTLASRMGSGERVVYDAIAELERVGFLGIQRRPGQTNLYRRRWRVFDHA
jgi:helix-turn-helix protein